MGYVIWLVSALLAPLLWLIPQLTGAGAGLRGAHAHCAERIAVDGGYLMPYEGCLFGAAGHAILTGLAIVGAAFLLSWATELAEEFVPPAFALIVLALISVLPEYAVDMHFAWEAGKNPEYRAYAVANMTGANRVLIGVGWTMLVFVLFFRTGERTLEVHPNQRLELGFLLLATIYSLILPIKGTLTLIDTAVLVAIFGAYVWRSLKTTSDEHPLVGPAAWIHDRVGRPGRIAIIALFGVYACVGIWFAAEPFAEGLIQLGRTWQVDEFILIQLVAPLASESPEFIVAILFVLRHRESTALGALVSSKVNQWTLLVGAIPLVYGISSGNFDLIHGMELEARPREELLLTSAQSLFAIAILSDLRFTIMEALALLVLFVLPWFFSAEGVHYAFSALYFALVLVVGFRTPSRRRDFARLLRLRA